MLVNHAACIGDAGAILLSGSISANDRQFENLPAGEPGSVLPRISFGRAFQPSGITR
jgi:hypothetical protein